MSEFKWRHFEGEIILWAVRWYCRYGISYRDLEQMMGERGVPVDHSTIYRWVQRYAPEIERRLRWQWRRPRSTRWQVDETYVKVHGAGPICTERSTSLETRLISISRRHGTPKRRSAFSAKR
jgi:transposase, IS6 family